MRKDGLSIDVALGVTVPARHARGRAARLGPAIDAILANHGYPPVIERLLAEALVLTALLGALLKEPEGQLTLQAQTEAGIVDLLVCDYLGGELRGYVRHDPDRLAEAGPTPSLFALFGKGYLAITFDQPKADERYQGIVRSRAPASPRRRRASSASRSRSRASSALPPASRTAIGLPAACCSSICRKARRAASGTIPASTIPTGRMSPCWPAR